MQVECGRCEGTGAIASSNGLICCPVCDGTCLIEVDGSNAFNRLPELPSPEEFEAMTADQQRYILRNLRITREDR